ncbi:MAG: ABC transporter permease [Gammaproteobacteria bacterium]|nr:ABC transporter permease [Gammaproteobacteria bacterium]
MFRDAVLSRGLATLGLSLGLAGNDLRHDRRVALTMVVAIAAVLAPLFLLLGLKTGVVETAKRQLLSDPRNLEIRIYQNARLQQTWFADMAGRSDVLFVLPRTRTINATIDLVTQQRRVVQSVEMVPTAAGDPLLPAGVAPPVDARAVLLSTPVAGSLGLAVGDDIVGVLRRRIDGRDERVEVPLRVAAVLPEHVVTGNAVFVTLDFLLAAEDYRDGYRVELLGDAQTGAAPQPRVEFANARVYATGLDEVLTLAALMRTQGLEVRTRASDIEAIKSIDRVLTFVFIVIATIAGVGGAIALGANVWINVDRKRRDLALLRLMGVPDIGVLLVPVWQALATAVGAFVLAYLAYLAGAAAFNRHLADSLPEQGYACVLNVADVGWMFVAVLLIATAASSVAGLRATRLDPAECLREWA